MGGLTLRGGRVVSRPPEGWNGNVFAWDVEVADVSFTAEVAGDEVGTVLVKDGDVQRRFAFRGVAVRGGGLCTSRAAALFSLYVMASFTDLEVSTPTWRGEAPWS